MVGRSQKSARYGNRAEKKMSEKYGLELDRKSWRDALDDVGRPVEVKATMRERESGEKGRFRLFANQHKQLEENDGRYIFVLYRLRGTGIQVLDDRVVDVCDIDVEWYPSEHHSPNRSDQKKIAYERVMR